MSHPENETHSEAFSPTDTPDFFDRERWHDVEIGEDDSHPSASNRERALTFTTFSLAVLFLVALLASVLGVWAAFSLQKAFLWETESNKRIDYRAVPTQWIGYAQERVFFCEAVNHATCFTASRQGVILIGDTSPPSLHQYNLNGALVQTIPVEEAPQCVACGEPDTPFAGTYLVGTSSRLLLYSDRGAKLAAWKLPSEKGGIWSLALSQDTVFAADSAQRVVYRFDRNGKLLNEIGRTPTPKTSPASSGRTPDIEPDAHAFAGFVVYRSPMSISLSPKTGIVYVANPGKHRIEAFTSEGHWEPSLGWGNASADILGFAGCCNPVDIASLEDGRIVTAEKSIVRVKVLHPDGKLDWVVAGPEMLETKPRNIPQLDAFKIRTVSDNNDRHVFLGVVEKGGILVFDPAWKIVRLFLPLSSQALP